MAPFQFPWETLLRLRRHERDVKRALLAEVLRHLDALQLHAHRISAQHRDQTDALKQMGATGPLDVAHSITRRSFVARLSGELAEIERQHELVAQQQEAGRLALVAAEQSVKSLEKLREKRHGEYAAAVERQDAKALDEAATAIRD